MPSASRDCLPAAIGRTFRSLLIGASLFARSRHDSCIGSDPFGEYSRVRQRLRSPSIQSDSENFDPLATAMVHRANAYLQGRRAAPADSVEPGTSGTAHSVITRRELLDLGNVRGKTVRQLVQRLHAQGAPGYRTFKTLGTNRSSPERADWPDDSPEHLALRLTEQRPRLSRAERILIDDVSNYLRFKKQSLRESRSRHDRQPQLVGLDEKSA
jgi:hypothetical protein